jgi:hypothetical protein
MSVGLHHGDAKQVYVAARYGEVFGTQDVGESWREMPLPPGVRHVYASLAASGNRAANRVMAGMRLLGIL